MVDDFARASAHIASTTHSSKAAQPRTQSQSVERDSPSLRATSTSGCSFKSSAIGRNSAGRDATDAATSPANSARSCLSRSTYSTPRSASPCCIAFNETVDPLRLRARRNRRTLAAP